jgi:ABC-2 type transport system permease protein
LILDEEAVATGAVDYHAQITTNFQSQATLRARLREAFDADRLRASGFDPQVVAELLVGARLTPRGVGKDVEGAASGESQFILALILFFVLYTMLLLHGQQILRSVLEEKSSRIVEVVISSLRPSELLGGKLIGVGAIAMTQLAIWILCGVAISGAASIGLLAVVDQLPRIPVHVVVHLVFLFLTGFAVYATLYAAVGAMHSNEQEAQQYNFAVMMPLILAAVLMPTVLSDPNSTLAVVGTFIPLFSPLVLMGRVAVDAAPGWQIAVAYVISVAFVAFEVWLAARIYRVGIIMYGKRPSLPELMRWIRH